MDILDLKQATKLGAVSRGLVLLNEQPTVRQGKRNPYMMGDFVTPQGNCQFKIWEERTYATVLEHGPGIYQVDVEGSEYNGVYLTVRRIQPIEDISVTKADFLPSIPKEKLTNLWQSAKGKLSHLGVSDKAWILLNEILANPELEGRYVVEGAAIFYHDNKIGGLLHHTGKMLNLLATLLENIPLLQDNADLLFLGVALHDIGKVFEYRDLALGEFWYANHRARGIEFIAQYKEKLTRLYSETFYRHLQSIIVGHHGDYGDRPTTSAAAIVHYIDTLESQVTGLIEKQQQSADGRFRFDNWGWLQGLPAATPDETNSGQSQ